MKWDQRALGACAAATVIAVMTPTAHAALTNGGFESGDFTGWTQTGDSSFSGVGSFAASAGSFGAFFGPTAAGGISQTFATNANTTYNVSFSLSLLDSSQPNSFSWTWNGVAQSLSFNNAAAFGYRDVSASVLSTGALSTLAFTFVDPQSFWLLDNVSVVAAVSAVPEPPVTALLAAGMSLLIAVAKRRKNSGF
jgi:hypothetical protein